MKAVLQHLRVAALLQKGDSPSDGQLLDSFLLRREEVAFETLLRRHGPMVMGVCRRVLRNTDDAEDAFQATFLVLARKAATVKPRDRVGNWLYGVAYRTAMKARAMSVKRRAKERQGSPMPRSEATADGDQEELLAQLDYELNRLPEKYRVPVVLCELEGKSRKEVARLLGMPEGTLSWRLAQAKKLLARRLSRYGTVAVAALLAEGAASARLSPALLKSTANAILGAGTVPAQVLSLTEGILKAMFLTKLKITFCAAGLMLLAGIGASGLTYRVTAQEPRQGTALASRPAADELESMRLEIEALRKSLQATRERVRTLEEEMRSVKGSGRAPMMKGAGNPMMGGAGGPMGGMGGGMKGGPMGGGGGMMGGPMGGSQPPVADPKHHELPAKRPVITDPFVEAEAALKKLRTDPYNKEANQALERALKRMKAKEKERQHSESLDTEPRPKEEKR